MRRLLALPVALVLMSCFPQAEPADCVRALTFASGPALAVPIGHPGEPFTLPISWESGARCPVSKRPIVHQVQVEVTGGDNLPVPGATARAPLLHFDTRYNDAWDSVVSFTPTVEGPYHLVASFEPEGGLVQKELWVASDHRLEAAASIALTDGIDCFRVEHTTQGSQVCSAYDGRVLRFKDGVLRNSWLGASARVDGDAIWLSATTKLFRYLDLPDGGLDSTSLTTEIGPTFWVSENELVHWVRDAANHVHFDGAALATVGRVPSLSLEVVAVAADPSEGTVAAATLQSWARFPLDVAVDGGVLFLDGEGATHQDRDGIWIEEVSGAPAGSVSFVPADARKPVLHLKVPDGWLPGTRPWTTVSAGERPLFFPRREFDVQETAPQLDGAEVLVPVVRGDRIELWHFAAPDGANFSDVSSGLLRATRAAGEHLFFPVTP